MSSAPPLKPDYVSATIHKDFYYNQAVESPTLIKEYGNIEKILVNAQYLACITIQIPMLHKIEYQYGSQVYNKLLGEVTQLLKEVKQGEFRDSDIFLVDLFDVDTFIFFLTPPRDQTTLLLDHLEQITERTRVSIDQRTFNLFYPYTKTHTKPAVGCAMVIKNPMINNIRQITRLVSHSKNMGEFLATRHNFHSKYTLQKLIIQQDIQTVFQPIVDMQSLNAIGYEALSRGPADTEFASPLLLFVLAEEFGLSFELDTLCRRKAFERAKELESDTKIFVNTLTMTIHDPEFRGKYLEELLHDLKIKPHNVVFEINEKLAIDNYDLFRDSMKDYSDIGIVQASDDIGNGYSDLERIMELNPGYMKLDIALVRNIHHSYIKQQIVQAMVSLARGIGSQIIAEGIEQPGEYLSLRELGVDYGQGYLFGRPTQDLQPADSSWLATVDQQSEAGHDVQLGK